MSISKPCQVFDGGGSSDSDSANDSPHRRQWVTGKLPIGHVSGPDNLEITTGLRTQTTAESAGDKRLQLVDGGHERDINGGSGVFNPLTATMGHNLEPSKTLAQNKELIDGRDNPSVLLVTMGPQVESKETLGPDKEEGAPQGGQRVFNGIPRGSTTLDVLHPHQVKNTNKPAALDETVATATTESQALACESMAPDKTVTTAATSGLVTPDETIVMAAPESQAFSCGWDDDWNEQVFPRAACMNGRLVSSPVEMNTEMVVMGHSQIQQLVDMSSQHVVQPFIW